VARMMAGAGQQAEVIDRFGRPAGMAGAPTSSAQHYAYVRGPDGRMWIVTVR